MYSSMCVHTHSSRNGSGWVVRSCLPCPRELTVLFNENHRIVQYDISSESFESIHSHNAYAELSRDKRLD